MTRRMISTDLSVIIPMRNLEQEIAGIMRSAADQASGLNVEFIVVDMGSSDRGILEALSVIKESKLTGYVVQNGKGTIGAAFNTGIYKASGEYITFLFPRRLYRDFIVGYYQDAKDTNGDIVYGIPAGERFICGTGPASVRNGSEVLLDLLRAEQTIDIGAVMLKRSFLLDQHVLFTEDCSFGYSEEFIMSALLRTRNAVKSNTLLIRDKVYQVKGKAIKPTGAQYMERVEALKRVYDAVLLHHKSNTKLIHCFVQEKLPDAVLSCVDTLLDEGMGYNAVRGILRVNGYEELLCTGKQTGRRLRKHVHIWKALPWMYKSRSQS